MKVRNMTGRNGNSVPNQFIIEDERRDVNDNIGPKRREVFQSYDRVIVVRLVWDSHTIIMLDERYWDYSRTTGKYRNQFLGETKAETQAKINSGEYELVDLN
jgi:hypothetical protein